MAVDLKAGLFGKLPAHGDFVMRDLPSSFVNGWDEWLQHYIAGSREQLGNDWLNIYLTSPIWRFVLSAGVIDDNKWAGIMLPSVDRVGRYYPLSAIIQLPEIANPLDFMTMHSNWFDNVEELTLQALNGEMTVDDLSEQINDVEIRFNFQYQEQQQTTSSESCMHISMEFEEQLPVSVFPYLFDTLLKKSYSSYGAWSTDGSERVEPCFFVTQSMPSISGIPAMLDGQWQHWGWSQPYSMNAFEPVEPVYE